jgi:hypothetical protein
MKTVLSAITNPGLVAPVALTILPGLNILLRIGYPIASPAALVMIALLSLLGLILALLCHRFPRHQRTILTVLLIWVVWQGEGEAIMALGVTAAEWIGVEFRIIFAVTLIVGILVIRAIVVALRQHAMLVASAFGGVAVIGTLTFVQFDEVVLPPHENDETVANADLPPFVLVILDEQIGIGGLPPELPDATRVAERLRETYSGFFFPEHAHSRYSDTRVSVPAIMNGVTGSDHPDAVPSPSGWRVGGNVLYDHLSDLGYAIHTYSSGYPDLCEDEVAVCHRFSAWHMGLFHRSGASLLAKVEQLLRRLGVSFGGQFVPHYGPLASIEIVDQMANDLRSNPRGQAFVAHLLMPHHPYILDEECAIVDRTLSDPLNFVSQRAGHLSEERRLEVYNDYLDQVLCADSQVRRVLDALRQSGTFDEATIVVTGDHGARLSIPPLKEPETEVVSDRDALDLFSTLIAIKTPGAVARPMDQSISIQDLIAEEVLNFKPAAGYSGSAYLLTSPEGETQPVFRDVPLPPGLRDTE